MVRCVYASQIRGFSADCGTAPGIIIVFGLFRPARARVHSFIAEMKRCAAEDFQKFESCAALKTQAATYLE